LAADDQNYFQSTYNNQYLGLPGERPGLLKASGELNGVLLGADVNPGQYTSEAKAQFGAKSGGLPERVRPTRQAGSLDLGQGPGDYLTQYGETFTDKSGQRENNKLSKDDMAKLKGMHFKTGFQGTICCM
jgi:hypothetical protein